MLESPCSISGASACNLLSILSSNMDTMLGNGDPFAQEMLSCQLKQKLQARLHMLASNAVG